MQTTRNADRRVSEWLARIRIPAFARASLFALFAIAGSLLPQTPMAATDAASAPPPIREHFAAQPDSALGASGSPEPEVRDPAIAAHEALDPVGVGYSALP